LRCGLSLGLRPVGWRGEFVAMGRSQEDGDGDGDESDDQIRPPRGHERIRVVDPIRVTCCSQLVSWHVRNGSCYYRCFINIFLGHRQLGPGEQRSIYIAVTVVAWCHLCG
jgi:hypothetical protein